MGEQAVRMISPAEAGEQIGVSGQRIRQLINAGNIPGTRRGRRYVIPLGAWEKYLAEQERAALAAAGMLNDETPVAA